MITRGKQILALSLKQRPKIREGIKSPAGEEKEVLNCLVSTLK